MKYTIKTIVYYLIGDNNINKIKEIISGIYYYKFKKYKKIIYFLTPTHGNMGDQMIAYATNKYLKDNFNEYKIIEIYRDHVYKYAKSIKKILNKEDLIFLHGGGNMGDLYLGEEITRRFIIENFTDNKIISMTQTMSFIGKNAKKELEISKNIYNKHKDLVLLARENISYENMKNNFVNAKVIKCPDIVLYMNNKLEESSHIRNKIMTCLRNDKESLLLDKKYKLIDMLKKNYSNIYEYDTHIYKQVLREDRELEIKDMLSKFFQSKLVITDRLHGMVFAAITKTPCIVTKSLDHKVLGTYEWIKDLNYIKLVDELTFEKINPLIDELLNLTELSKIDLEEKYFSKLKEKMLND